MRNFLLFIFIIASIISCGKKNSGHASDAIVSDVLELQYAKGFQVNKTADYTHITIRNPWDTAAILHSYVLVDKQKKLPDNLPKGNIIRTPVSNIVATSALHCSVLNELNSIEAVKGVCEPHYIKNKYIVKGVADGAIANLGMANSPNLEGIIMLSPDVVFSDPIAGKNLSNLEKAKIPLVWTTDYTEPHPLGRAEWLRFYALFLDQEAVADSLFARTVKDYDEVKGMIGEAAERPTVFADTRYQGNWHMPGGQSNTARLISDAGGAYIWADDRSTTSVILPFESVLDKAGDGDKWIIRYYDEKEMTYASLGNEYKAYSYFKAFKNKEVYACNTQQTTYYDDLPIHPDWILKDLAYVFHPELFQGYESKYFKKVD